MNAMERARGGLLALVLGVLTAGCGDSPSSAPHASAVVTGETLDAAAEVNSTVTPAVVVVDGAGRPLRGSRVTFEVTAGGGTLESATATSDARGRAEATWRLGTAVGRNAVQARTGTETVTFTVQGLPGAPARMEPVMEAPPVAPVGGPVGLLPGVRLSDAWGNGVPGVAVEFRVVRGGGTVSGGSSVTDPGGIAAVGSWTVGGAPGENELEATSPGVAPVRFRTEAVAVSSGWLHLTPFAGDSTTCPADTAGCRFTVRVTDATDSPVTGETILWVGPGGASGTSVTNRSGLATSPNLGTRQPGSYTQTARLAGGGEEAAFRYRIVASGGFNIDLRFVGSVTPAVRAAFEGARLRWQEVITGNLPEFALTGTNQVGAKTCGIDHPAVNEVVDDVLIFAEIVPIDGPGQVLGSAGPCLVRGGSGLPILGVIKLDSDDLALMERNGTLRDVILHEIGHVLGIGTLWGRRSLVRNAGTQDPYYVGARAQSGFVLGGGFLFNGVPVENTGGQGTRDSHWRKSALGNELMTGFISSGHNAISSITIGSLMDLGYQVNFGAADAWALPGTLGAFGHHGEVMQLHELPMPAPREVW
jgi:hypothetical protein